MADRQQVTRLAGLAAVAAGTMAMVWTPPAGVPDYSLAAVRGGAALVPRSFAPRLPAGVRNGASLEERKRLFLKTMSPVILRANESIMKERRRLARLAAAGSALDGRKLVAGLKPYSEKAAAYVRLVRRVIAAERLWQFDGAAVASIRPIP